MGRKISRKEKVLEVFFDCCRELYKEATPSADFDKLFAEAKTKQVSVDHNAYFIDKDKFERIGNKYLNKVDKHSIYYRSLRMEIWLGATPTTSKEYWENHLKEIQDDSNISI